MSHPVGNPEDWFSHVEAQLLDLLLISSPEPLGSQGELIGWP